MGFDAANPLCGSAHLEPQNSYGGSRTKVRIPRHTYRTYHCAIGHWRPGWDSIAANPLCGSAHLEPQNSYGGSRTKVRIPRHTYRTYHCAIGHWRPGWDSNPCQKLRKLSGYPGYPTGALNKKREMP